MKAEDRRAIALGATGSLIAGLIGTVALWIYRLLARTPSVAIFVVYAIAWFVAYWDLETRWEKKDKRATWKGRLAFWSVSLFIAFIGGYVAAQLGY